MITLSKAQIAERIDMERAATAIEEAYIASSAGQIELPPVGHITFPGGDCHIKYGHRRGDQSFVIKVATGFPDNATSPVNNGLSLVMSAETGEVEAILHDEMLLTDIRTGIGGAIASRTLASSDASRLLIVGTGVQAYRQIEAHLALFDRPLDLAVWGRSPGKAAQVAARFDGCTVIDDLAAGCGAADIIVSTTAARTPLISAEMITPGTHITAVGADAPGKHELAADVLAVADVLVADSADQCRDHGEFSVLDDLEPIVEIGQILAGQQPGRTTGSQITVADLTGTAAQDLAIAQVVLGDDAF